MMVCLGLALMACQTDLPKSISLLPTKLVMEHAGSAIQKVGNELNAAVGHNVLGDPWGKPVYLDMGNDPEMEETEVGATWCNPRCCYIMLRPWLKGRELEHVLRHELGHAFGLDHTKNHQDVMYWREEDGQLTEEAIERWGIMVAEQIKKAEKTPCLKP